MRFNHKLLLTMLARLSAAGVLALICLQAASTNSYSQTFRFSQPIQLSPDFGWFPDITTDAMGRVHVVWSVGDSAYDSVMYVTNPNGREWSNETDIAAMPSGGEVTRPAIVADKYGILHMSFRETSIYYTQAPINSASMAAAWQLPVAMSGSQVAYFSRLAIDQQGRLHLVYTENVSTPECPVCFHVFYRQSADNGLDWTAPLDIADLPTGSAKPQILVDQQDNLHVVWESGQGGSYGQLVEPTTVMYAASYDNGQTWTKPLNLGAAATRSKNIAIGLDGEGKLIVVWLGEPEDIVYYQTSSNQGRNWTSPRQISQVWGGYFIYQARLDDYSMATDSAGNIHLAIVGRTAQDQTSLSVLHMTWNGSTWDGPDAITTLTGDVPEWPRIAIGLGQQVHVVWFVRDQAHIFSENGNYRVWYANMTLTSPRLTPVPAWPTPIPPPTTTAPPPTSTPLATAAIAPGAPQTNVESLFTETDTLTLLAKALAPVLLLAIGVIVFVYARRH